MLLRYAMRRVRRDEEARDLVQDTWTAAIEGIDGFAGRAKLGTWVTGILRRKIIDRHRRARPMVAFEEAYHGAPEEPHRERLDDAAALDFLRGAIEELPQRERSAVLDVDVGGMSRYDAASNLGITRNNLRVILHRARARLRIGLEQAKLV